MQAAAIFLRTIFTSRCLKSLADSFINLERGRGGLEPCNATIISHIKILSDDYFLIVFHFSKFFTD